MLGMNWIEHYLKAGNPETSQQQLENLARSENKRIRMRVAENPRATREVLERLATDPDSDVRLAVTTNRFSPHYLVEQLSHDQDASVRHGIAEDPLAPRMVLQTLAQDHNPYVSCRAKKTLAALERAETTVVDLHALDGIGPDCSQSSQRLMSA